ncbi:FG-GAP repeat-containing protein [Prosthecobacter debontii]|uniref:FG-GAP repeat-containing protein n=1 Tax=Prosthecobacter debontii TaxID=48467 RepID=A0A1T4Y6A9_9BACT|nr:choice-of-anchor tandem repeat NxxGxxAF-containing protein [Prosthecobacter debontii]SKA97276.1 FG-GAP repeat-containing protein [Prosthecobacter debontii]
MKLKTLFYLGLLAYSVGPVAGIGPTVLKILPTQNVEGEASYFGSPMALNERWLLISDAFNDRNAEDAGIVYVCDPKTGKHLRQLTPTDPSFRHFFGSGVALYGNIATVGASGDDDVTFDAGAVYLFDVSTGEQIHKFTAMDGLSEDGLGACVALNDRYVFASAYQKDGAQGAVYVFDLQTGETLHKLMAGNGDPGDGFGLTISLSGPLVMIYGSNAPSGSSSGSTVHVFDVETGVELHMLSTVGGLSSDGFGSSIAASGHLALIGASRDRDLGASAGAAYIFDLRTGEQLHKLTATDGSSSDYFGAAVALSGNLALIGAYGADGGFSGTGAVYLFDLQKGTQITKLYAADHRQNNSQYGRFVALHGGTAVISAGSDNELEGFGAAYLMQGLAAQLPTVPLARKGDFAPLTNGATFASFTTSQMNADGEGLLMAGLANAPKGQTSGLWSELAGSLDLLLRTGDAVGDLKVSALQTPVTQHSDHAAFYAKLSGTGVSALNDLMLVRDDGDALLQLLREGDTLMEAGFSGQAIKSLGAMAVSTTQPQVAVLTTLSAASTADSAIVLHDLATDTVLDGLREGDESPVAGVNYGQISRVSMTGSMVIANVALSGDKTANNAVVGFSSGAAKTILARKGDTAPGTAGKFSVFKGECSSGLNDVLVRATLSGVSGSMNEGLWAWKDGSLRLVAQKGAQVSGLTTGMKYAQFVRSWICGGERVLVLAKLSGTGIKGTNDQALLLILPSGDVKVLMQEGDVFPGTDAATIGTIQQVEVDAGSGTYAIMGTLLGVSKSADQCLWVGDVDVSITPGYEALLRPGLRLREGSYQGLLGGTASLTTMKLLVSAETTGMGGRGLGSPVSGGGVAVLLTFSDKSQQVGILR